jgi:large subunit ribosomal protein L25
MAESVAMVAEKREGKGSRKAEKLRKSGKVPGVVYGHKEETEKVALSTEELVKAIQHKVRVIDLKTSRGVQKALIRELQWDHLGKSLLHVDFARVAADERIQVSVPIELRGVAPGVTGGGVLDQPLHTLAIECLAISIPESIRVNIGELQLDGAIHVKDLHLPEGVKATGDPDAIVVHVTAPAAEPEAPAEPGATAEPEIIGRKPADEEEGEEEKEKEKK